MLREAPRLPAAAHDTGDWLHTAVYLALPGHRALLFPGAAADAEVIATVERRGGVVIPMPSAVDRRGPVPPGDRRVGDGRAPGRRAVAPDIGRGTLGDQPASAARTSPTRSMVSRSNGWRKIQMTSSTPTAS